MRKIKPFSTTRSVWEEQFSLAHGLPAEDKQAGLERLESTGGLKPAKEAASGDSFKIKLQDTAHHRAFFRLQERDPKRGMWAARAVFKKAMGKTAKMVAMAAGPTLIRARFPKDKSAQTQLPSMSLKMNVIACDENGDVTFQDPCRLPVPRRRARRVPSGSALEERTRLPT